MKYPTLTSFPFRLKSALATLAVVVSVVLPAVPAGAEDLLLRPGSSSAAATAAPNYAPSTDLSKIPKFRSGFTEKPVRGMPYYVEFRARTALSYGHTFLVHGKLNGGRIASGTVVGLHPAGEDPRNWVMGHFLPVRSETGASDGDTEDVYVAARYRVNLTAQQYQSLLAHLKQKTTVSTTWHAVMNNCNNFVGEVANYMGLKAPGSSMLMPAEYINTLKSINGGVNVAPGVGARASSSYTPG